MPLLVKINVLRRKHNKMAYKLVSFVISDELYNKLVVEAKKQLRSKSAIVRFALKAYLK